MLRRPTVNAAMRIDPTRTSMLRRSFCKMLRAQFARLKGRIIVKVAKEDAFGLGAKLKLHSRSDDYFVANILEVPDIRQKDHYSCGAAAAMAVGRYLGVGPATLQEWKCALKTDVEESTKPQAIIEYFTKLGVQAEARSGMVIDDLRDLTRSGRPVICPVQDYGPWVPSGARFAYGHYLVVCWVDMGYVFCQDSSEDNVIADSGSAQEPGKVMIAEADWMRIWHDKDSDGEKYVQYGIALGEAPTANAQWSFATDAGKVDAFQAWLEELFDGEVLGEDAWARYIEQGYRKGVGRAYDDVRRKPLATDPIAYTGGREEFLRSSFAGPVAAEKVKLLASRAFDDLDNVTSDMSTKMSRALADGFVRGDSPREIAKSLSDAVDIGEDRAERIARTEVIRAHAEGQLDAMEDLGVTDVGVQVEWIATKGACPKCEELEGTIMDIEDAHGLIPYHPECRCAWAPAVPAANANPNHGEHGKFASGPSISASEPEAVTHVLRTIAKLSKHNLANLADIKDEYPHWTASEMHGVLKRGERQGRIVLSASEGRTSDRERAAGIREADTGSMLLYASKAPTANYNPHHGEHGYFAESDTSKYIGAKVGKAEHVHSAGVEREVAAAIGGEWEEDNAAYDILKGEHGIEVKSLLKGSKQSISVHDDALLRKVEWLRGAPGRRFHTVAVDERSTYDGGTASFSGHRMYYKRGSGRYSLPQMHPVKDVAELKALIAAPDRSLPPKARGSLPGRGEIRKLKAAAERAHASRLAKDRSYKARKKLAAN